MKKRFKILGVLLFLGILFLHFYLPRIITEIRNPLTQIDFDEVELPKEVETKYFTSFDGLKLCYNLRYTNQPITKGTIILLHGIRSRKEQYLELSQYLSLRGYNTVALDLRAHGKSEGTHCTFGVKEKQDISFLIDKLSSLGIVDEIGIWGQSLGGAITLQATAYDSRIKYAIVESTFTDLKTIVADYMEFNLGFKSKFLNQYLVYRAGKIAGFTPAEASPLLACKNITVPILLVHGNHDKRINIKYGKANFQNINSKHKQFLEIDKATHLNVWKIGGEEYFKQVLTFLENVRHEKID